MGKAKEDLGLTKDGRRRKYRKKGTTRDLTKTAHSTIRRAIFLEYGNIYATCKRLKASRSTFYRLMKKHPIIKEWIEQAKDLFDDRVENVIANLVLEQQNPNMTMFYARTKMKHRGYNDKVEIAGDLDLQLVNDAIIALEQSGLDPKDVFQQIVSQSMDGDVLDYDDIEDEEMLLLEADHDRDYEEEFIDIDFDHLSERMGVESSVDAGSA